MTKLETPPLDKECLEGLAQTIAKFLAPHDEDEPSAEKPRRVSPEIAARLQIEIKTVNESSATDQEASDANEECLNELADLMTKYLDKHQIPSETIASFPNEKCLNELADVMSDFFIESKVPPETIGSLQVNLKYKLATQEGIVAVALLGCVRGGPPHAPCPVSLKWGIIRSSLVREDNASTNV